MIGRKHLAMITGRQLNTMRMELAIGSNKDVACKFWPQSTALALATLAFDNASPPILRLLMVPVERFCEKQLPQPQPYPKEELKLPDRDRHAIVCSAIGRRCCQMRDTAI